MRHFASFVLFSFIGCLIVIQRDIDGSALISGFHGLGLAVLGCIAGQVWSLAGAMRIAFTREDV